VVNWYDQLMRHAAVTPQAGGPPVIERHLTFNVHPEATAAFERFFAEVYAPRMAESPGFIRVELIREQDHPTRHAMVLRWADPASATTWRRSIPAWTSWSTT